MNEKAEELLYSINLRKRIARPVNHNIRSERKFLMSTDISCACEMLNGFLTRDLKCD